MVNLKGPAMHRASHVLLSVLVILSLTCPNLLDALTTVSAQAAPAHAPAASADAHENAPRAEKKHRKKKANKNKEKARKKDRKQKERKRDRKRDGKRQGQQGGDGGPPAELPTGVLPAADAAGSIQPDGTPSVQDRYIVRLQPTSESPLRAARTMARDIDGVTPTHVYSHVFDGFAAVIPPDKLDDVRNDPRVTAVVPDTVVYAQAQTIPTGIRRIDADENPTADIDGTDEPVDVDVAVVDTAGNDTHEDLDIHAWANCTPSQENGDDNGHGTVVGGVIGARDNGIGVVGVAPGARLWNIRVLIDWSDGKAVGLTSWVICGLDLITMYATPQADGLGDIEVANISFGALSTDDSDCLLDPGALYHQGYCAAVAAGVTMVVSAGNSDADAAGFVPASFDEAIAVSALADSNGQGGTPGAATSAGPDESLATFSNWGADIDIAAPGVAILSTAPTGSCTLCSTSGYRSASGTSLSAPHVAGAAALYLSTYPEATPAQVKAAILAAREDVALPNDPDGINEGILNVGAAFG